MDKQQALKSWMEKTFPKGCNKVSVLKGRRSFEAGWEACLATLSPTDAVNFVHWILKNGWRVLEDYTFYKEIKAGGRIIKGARDLYTEFNPSGAAAQADEAKITGPWELKSHSHQIADTGDYDGFYEITNGDVTVCTQDDDDEGLQLVVDALNKCDCKFYDGFDKEGMIHYLKEEIKELRKL